MKGGRGVTGEKGREKEETGQNKKMRRGGRKGERRIR